jgi:hypothetical protein
MDPYLERLEIFPDFRDSNITYLRETLQLSLPDLYFAALGRRIWVEVSSKRSWSTRSASRITFHRWPFLSYPATPR